MRRFSRWMPPVPSAEMEPLGVVPCLLFFSSLVAAAIVWTAVAYVLFAVIAACVFYGFFEDRRLHRIAAERAGEDIGTFARAFDRRIEPFDPWVVRATWDALRSYVKIPLRPADRIGADLHIDDEDLEDDLLEEVAFRAGRSLDRLEANPMYRQVVTVGDFVRLVTLQPPLRAPEI